MRIRALRHPCCTGAAASRHHRPFGSRPQVIVLSTGNDYLSRPCCAQPTGFGSLSGVRLGPGSTTRLDRDEGAPSTAPLVVCGIYVRPPVVDGSGIVRVRKRGPDVYTVTASRGFSVLGLVVLTKRLETLT